MEEVIHITNFLAGFFVGAVLFFVVKLRIDQPQQWCSQKMSCGVFGITVSLGASDNECNVEFS